MYFKNLMLYRLTEPWALTAEELAEKLAEHEFHPCGSLDNMRYGFVPPAGEDATDFVHAANGYIMFCAQRQVKLLPTPVINEELHKKVKAIRDAEQRSVGRKEMQSIKDEIIFTLLPKAFTSSTLEYAYIAPADNLIVVNSTSSKRAEDLLSKLREALGSLRCIPLSAKGTPNHMMSHWMQTEELPAGFELGHECEMHAGKDGRVVSLKKADLTSDEARSHLNSGMYVSKVALTWKESVHFVVDDQLSVKGIKFDDVITEKANERNPESKAEQFDAEFAVMTFELKHFISDLLEAFGGESEMDAEPVSPAPQPKIELKLVTQPSHLLTGEELHGTELDSLYDEGVKFVVASQKASISSLQRELRIGYNRAASLIETMEEAGIVSHADHSGSRQVLVQP